MAPNAPISKDDKLLFPLFLISLVIVTILTGNFLATFLPAFILILTLSTIFSIIKIRKADRQLIDTIKESSYILCFSVATTTIAVIVLPYLLFHKSFVSIHVFQYVFLLPIVLIFTASLYVFSSIVHKTKLKFEHLLKISLSTSIVFSIILSIILIMGSMYIYNQRTLVYNENYNQAISELREKTKGLYHPNSEIFNEINEYQNNFLDKTEKQRNEFKNLDEIKGWCISTNCAKITVDKTYHLITVVVDSATIQNTLEQANQELKYIDSQEFRQLFGSLEEYKTHLRSKIETSDASITHLSDEHRNIIKQLESDFTYEDLQKLIEVSKSGENETMKGLFPETSPIFETDSVFDRGLSYALEHTTDYKELFKLVGTISIYTAQQGKNSDLFVQIYKNKDVQESSESKIVRYKLILNELEQ